MSEEFNLIEQYFKPLSQPLNEGELGIGDDGAIVETQPAKQLVVVTDTMVEGVHYPKQTDPYDIGWKLVAVNLSDLAAMGAEPKSYSLAVTLPSVNAEWLESFALGLQRWAIPLSIPLIGGDTTKGQQTVLTLSAIGEIPTGLGILRKNAKVGDWIFVSGSLGSAGLGLKWVLEDREGVADTEPVQRLNRPVPKVALGQALRGIANSMIDISDGLVADLGHICTASNCSAWIGLDALPISEAVADYIDVAGEQGYQLPLAAGDDYELCFTVSPEKLEEVLSLAQQLGEPVSVIGRMGQPHARSAVWVCERLEQCEGIVSLEHSNAIGTPASAYLTKAGYQHF